MNQSKGDNKLIAEFMGFTPQVISGKQDSVKLVTPSNFKEIFGEHVYKPHGGNIDFPFHESWDWLMPVVEKVNNIISEKCTEFTETTNIHDPQSWKSWSYRHIYLSTNIDSVYRKVVEFIKWYNTNIKPHEDEKSSKGK